MTGWSGLAAVICQLVFCGVGFACTIDEFSKVNREMPSSYSELSEQFSTDAGQFAELRVYKRDGAIMSMRAEYYTDEKSALVRLVPGGMGRALFIGEDSDDEATRFEFAVCADGSVVPAHSPTKMLDDTEFQAMARSVINDFFVNPKIAPFTKQFLK